MPAVSERRKSSDPNPGASAAEKSRPQSGASKPEAEILFQKYFKSVGPRTYAVQLKEAGNGNHFLVLTEGKRDDASGDIRKTRLFVFSEDFKEFFKMMHEAAVFIRENPLSDEVKQKREKFWAKRNGAPVARLKK